MTPIVRRLLCVAMILIAPWVSAAPPQTINYQGYLTSSGGVPVNSAVVMTFRLYNAASGGAAIYSETQLAVGVSNGSFSAVIGSVVPLSLPFDVPYWLTVAINADAEMSPRQPLSSSPYAFRASSLDSSATVDGAQVTGTVASAGSANVATMAMLAGGLQGTLPASQVSGALTGATLAATQLTGTLGSSQLAATQRLPTVACAASEIAQWNGTAWICAAASSGSNGTITGNLTLVASTPTTGNILKGANRFIHNAGVDNTFVGELAGNFAITGNSNTASGRGALQNNSAGSFNTATGANALAANTGGASNTASGASALYSNTVGLNNTASGDSALFNNTSGNSNTAIGPSALYNNTFGNSNTAIGNYAMISAAGSNNTALGAQALTGLSNGGNNNIALGYLAGSGINGIGANYNIHVGNIGALEDRNTIRIGTAGDHTATFIAGVRDVTPGIGGDLLLPVVVASNGQFGTLAAFPAGPAGPQGPQGAAGADGAIGAQGPAGPAGPNDIAGNLTMVNSTPFVGNIMKGSTLFIHNAGTDNAFLGANAGNSTVTGSGNSAVGAGALGFIDTGSSNVAVGNSALRINDSGGNNTAVGAISMFNNRSGVRNSAYGTLSLAQNAGGSDNTALGANAMQSNMGGNNNTAIGQSALSEITTGNGNIAVGQFAGFNISTGSNNIAIGNNANASDAGVVRIGQSTVHTKTYVAGIRGVTPGVADAMPVVIDSNGQLGTGAAAAAGVTSVATGSGLTGGPITSAGTIGLASTQLLPTVACGNNQVVKWNGSAWACGADNDTNSGGTVTSITAGGGLTGGTITGAGTLAVDPASAVLTNNYFKFGGNSIGATAVLGSTDNVPVEIIANGTRAMRIEPNAFSPNIAHGHDTNNAGGSGLFGATVSGGGESGSPNAATNSFSTVGGGTGNTASGRSSTVGGGISNTAGGNSATVGGGFLNSATGIAATVGGGQRNTASGISATVAGGDGNNAVGFFSFAAGQRAKANADGCFIWADFRNVDFVCNNTNAFMVRATGGFRFVTSIDGTGNPTSTTTINPNAELEFGSTTRQMLKLYGAGNYGVGVQSGTLYQRTDNHFAWYVGGTHSDAMLTPGGTGVALMTLTDGSATSLPVSGVARAQSFVSTSDRASKAAFASVDGIGVLAALAKMPVQSWQYRNEGEAVRHIGPTAQDFRAAFGVGYDDKTIAMVDAAGVALAAIQGLNQLVAGKDALIDAQGKRIQALEDALAAIQSRLGLK